MNDAYELTAYLPLSFKYPTEQQYIEFLWEAFNTNYENEKYQFAFLAYHMLTMSFIYFNIWQIKQSLPSDFKKGLIGFSKEIESKLLTAASPFTFSTVNERSILRLLKLIECDNSKIGNYAKLVDDRNLSAHPNGNIYYNDKKTLSLKIVEVLNVVDDIQTHSVPIIESCYKNFLIDNNDQESWEYVDENDQIREALIHQHYFSQMDVDICINFELNKLGTFQNMESIQKLHNALKLRYTPDEN